MALTCPRCSRSLSDSGNPGEVPSFCMYCGERLKPVVHDETIVRPVQPSPIHQLLSAPPEEAEDFAGEWAGEQPVNFIQSPDQRFGDLAQHVAF